MNRRITREDLEALTRTETEILSLPSTEQSTTFEPLSSSEEFQLREGGHGHEIVLVVRTCEGKVGGVCEHHADEFLADYFNERALRIDGRESELSVCEDCGLKTIDCIDILAINPAFLGINP